MAGKRLSALCGLLLATLPAEANFDDGNALYRSCTSQEPFHKWYCLGFVAGVWDGLEAADYVCFGEGRVTKGQTVDVVVKYLRENPAKRAQPAGVLIKSALSEAFTCQNIR